jgi:hypothetical protein
MPAGPGLMPAGPGLMPAGSGLMPAGPGLMPAGPGLMPAGPRRAGAVPAGGFHHPEALVKEAREMCRTWPAHHLIVVIAPSGGEHRG